MTNAELLAKIKAEIERQKTINKSLLEGQLKDGCLYAFNQVLSFLSTLEPEKPMSQEGLEEELDKWRHEHFNGKRDDHFSGEYLERTSQLDIARHFYDLGCRRTAEKFDEIEYNRQRAEESVPNDLEEAAEISFDEAYALTGDYTNFLAKGLTKNRPRPIGPHWFCEYAKNRFIAGAKWDRQQMMKEAIGGNAYPNDGEIWVDLARYGYKFKEGEPCRIIIVKEEENGQSD